ncbi:hypothetical protein HDU92_003063 [Lobulomyces angularis]|nr:hypothetical protein HDU92_003063 [Lobulomyces angularis]
MEISEWRDIFYSPVLFLLFNQETKRNQQKFDQENVYDGKKKDLNLKKNSTPFEDVLESLLKTIFSTSFSTPATKFYGKLTHDYNCSDFEQNLLKIINPNIEDWKNLLYILLTHHLRSAVASKLWNLVLIKIHRHVVIYKKIRRELLHFESRKKDSNMELPTQHLDEFNDDSSWDFGCGNSLLGDSEFSPSDDLNLLIAQRMKAQSLLHPASACDDEESEKSYLRTTISNIMSRFKALSLSSSPSSNQASLFTSSKLLELLFREYLVCKVSYPLLHYVSSPGILVIDLLLCLDFINKRLLIESHKIAAIQSAIKKFKNEFDLNFTTFNPRLLQKSSDTSYLDVSDKSKLFELLAKYSKRVQSVLDAKTVSFQINNEICRIAESENPDLVQLKCVKRLTEIQAKYSKKIFFLLTGSTGGTSELKNKRIPEQNEGLIQPKIFLREFLDEYVTREELNENSSVGLHFFLEFMEKEDEKIWWKVKFWVAIEKFRKLESTLGNSQDGLNVETPTLDRGFANSISKENEKNAVQLWTEAKSIYSKFFPIGSKTCLEIEHFETYLSLKKLFSTEKPGDYQCLYQIQGTIFNELKETTWKKFLHSNSYFQFVSETQKTKIEQKHIERKSGDVTWFDTFKTGGESTIQAWITFERLAAGSNENLYDAGSSEIAGSRLLHQFEDILQFIAASSLGKASHAKKKSHKFVKDKTIDFPDFPPDIEEEKLEEKAINQVEEEDILPGELLKGVSKLQQIERDIEKTIFQIDLINILSAKQKAEVRTNSAVSVLAFSRRIAKILDGTKELLKQEIGDLSKQKAKLLYHELGHDLSPGNFTIVLMESDILNNSQLTATTNEVNKSLSAPLTPNSTGGSFSKTKIGYYRIKVEKYDKIGWIVTRKESEFYNLYRKLKELFPNVNDIEVPPKSTLFHRNKIELKSRKDSWENFLKQLIVDVTICQSEVLRSFLSKNHEPSFQNQQNFNNANSVEGDLYLNDSSAPNAKKFVSSFSKFLQVGGKKIYNQQSLFIPTTVEKNILQKTKSVMERSPTTPVDISHSKFPSSVILTTPLIVKPDLQTLDNNFIKCEEPVDEEDEIWGSEEDLQPSSSPTVPQDKDVTDLNPLVEPLCKIMLEIFDFSEQTLWLKRNAAVMLIKQWWGVTEKGTVEAAVNDFLQSIFEDHKLIQFIEVIKDLIINKQLTSTTNNGNNEDSIARRTSLDGIGLKEYSMSSNTANIGNIGISKLNLNNEPILQRQNATNPPTNFRDEAKSKLVSILPDSFSRILGTPASAQGIERCFEVFQNQTLNKSLVYSILEELENFKLSDDINKK